MTLAFNPQSGEALFLSGGQWQPAQQAVNPNTGETVAFDGSQWSKLPGKSKPQGDLPPATNAGGRSTGAGNDPGTGAITAIVASAYPGDTAKAGQMASRIALQLGVAPNLPLSVGQQRRAQGLLRRYSGQGASGQPPPAMAATIQTAAKDYGLDPSLLTDQLARESGFDPNAVSPAGARGVAQFEPDTAKQYNVNVASADSSIVGAAHLDSDLLKRFDGNQGLALAGYNWGPARTQRWLQAGADPKRMPKETRDYILAITGRPIEDWVAVLRKPTDAAQRVAQSFVGVTLPPNAPAAPMPAPGAPQPQNGTQVAAPQTQPQAPANQQPQGPLPNVPPLPINPATGQRFTNPWEAIQAIRAESARLSMNPNPRVQAQVPLLDKMANDIETSLKPVEVRPGVAMIDPRTGRMIYQGTPTNPAALALQRFLADDPNATPQQIQAFTQSGRAGRSAISMYMTRYLEENPNATADEVKRAAQLYTTQTTAQNRFLSGPQGNTIRSLNVVVSHLQTMQDLGNALQNGNIVAFNGLAQAWAEQTGQPAPTSFDTAKQIVGAEVIKALGVAGAGSQSERQEAADAFNRARSPQQLEQAIEASRKLLIGQLDGLRQQYAAATGLPKSSFDEMLQPETLRFFHESQKPESGKPDSQGWTTLPNGVKIREVQ